MLKRSVEYCCIISSLPGKFGIGTFGKEAYRFVDFLEETKQSYWQILPLTTTAMEILLSVFFCDCGEYKFYRF